MWIVDPGDGFVTGLSGRKSSGEHAETNVIKVASIFIKEHDKIIMQMSMRCLLMSS